MKKWIYILCFLGAFVAQGRTKGRTKGNVLPVLEITQPLSGKTYEGNVVFIADLRNVTNQIYKVRISCFDMVHHFIPEQSWQGWRIEDRYLPCSPGSHTLEVVVFLRDDPETILLSKEIDFRVKKPSQPDEDELNRALKTRENFDLAENRYAGLMSGFSSSDPLANRIQAWQADQLFDARVGNAIYAINNLSTLARYYMKALDPDRALGILETAGRIFEEDLPSLAVHPVKGAIPYYDWETFCYFFETFADLYVRYGHLDEALAWCDKEIVLYHEIAEKAKSTKGQRKAFYQLRGLHERVALYNLLLADDELVWEEHQSKADAFYKKGLALEPPKQLD